MSRLKTVEIESGVYWVGGDGHDGGLHCNPYLIVDGEEAVLIDPGSVLDFEYVFENICSIVPIEMVKYVVLHHQDPDLCSSVTMFEQKGASFKVVTHWRTQTLVKYYGIKSDYYTVNEHEFKLTLNSGRVLGFVQTPYLHFPGAIATYDYNTKILFSSDLFGAYSHEWSLYAGEDYIEKMKTFHEHYMPSNDILRPVMEVFLSMDISIIAPQHGSIIRGRISEHIKALRELECGTFIKPIRKQIKDGGYGSLCSLVFKRLVSIYGKDELMEAIKVLDIKFEIDTLDIIDYNYTGNRLWNIVFEQILAKKGIQWLIVIEPLVNRLSKEYDINIPDVFATSLKKVEQEALSTSEENRRLREINDRLKISMKEASDKLVKCPITGLYNYDFFKNYLATELKYIVESSSYQNPALVIVSVDNLARVRFSYGETEVDDSFKTISYIINSIKAENTLIFRLQGAAFACYIAHGEVENVRNFAEKVRNEIAISEKFIERLTVSIGLVFYDEIKNNSNKDAAEKMYNVAMMRVKLAKNTGMNIVCSNSDVDKFQQEIAKILIVDTDVVNLDVLKVILENLNYRVLTAGDGEEALRICEKDEPDIIISEIMMPKVDGFLVREKLLEQSSTKIIPFIIVSYLKNEDSAKRAAALGITNYFKKPFMLSELVGVIKNKLKGEACQ